MTPFRPLRPLRPLLACLIVLLAFTGSAANKYVNASVGSSGNGASWSTAWKQPSNITGISAGDTVWFAGGSNYTSGFSPSYNGSAGNLIYFKRATAGDSECTGAAGWNSAFDSQVITPEVYWNSAGNGSYLYWDGRQTNGWQFQTGSASFDAGAWVFRQDGMHDITFTNCDAVGPGGTTPFNHQGDCGALSFRTQGSGVVSNVFIFDALMQGYPNIIYNLGANNYVKLTRVKISRNGSSNGSIHANIMYTGGGNHHFYFINCDISNWQVEGFNWYEQPAPNYPYWFIGCVFHDPMDQDVHSVFWPASEPSGGTPQGPVHLYNNTFSNVFITTGQGRTSNFGSTSTCSNNIFWSSTFNGSSPIPTASDYNFSSGSTPGGSSISSGSNPFTNYFKIISTVSSSYPRRKGIALPSAITDLGGNIDIDGVTRASPPSMGAFEFNGDVPSAGTLAGVPNARIRQ